MVNDLSLSWEKIIRVEMFLRGTRCNFRFSLIQLFLKIQKSSFTNFNFGLLLQRQLITTFTNEKFL